MKNKIFTISLISLIALGLIIPNINLGQLKNQKNPKNQTPVVETEPIQGPSLELLQQFFIRQLQEENQDIDPSLLDLLVNSLQAERESDGTIHFKPSESKTFLSSLSSSGDIEPPQLIEFDFTPKTIDTSYAPQTVTFTLRITDNSSGLVYAFWYLYSPSGQQIRYGGADQWNRISGDALDGVYQETVEFPQYSEEGTWYVGYMWMGDGADNSGDFNEQDLINLGFPTKLEVISVPEDIIPPQLIEFDFTPKNIDTSEGPQTVTFTLRTTDDLSGFEAAGWDFYSPSGQEREHGSVFQWDRISGNDLDGVYQGTIEFPQYSETGIWYVYRLFLFDKVGNTRRLFEQDLIDLGFPTKLVNGEAGVLTYSIAVILAEPANVPHEDLIPSGRPCKLDQFQSETYSEYNKKYYEDLAFCVADYHKENSFETINLDFTIYDNDGQWFRTNRNEEDYLADERDFVIDVIDLASSSGIDLLDEDIVIVLHSGTSSQQEKNKLTTETWSLKDQPLGYSPYKIIVAEDDLTGAWAHEIGHIIGALLTPENTIIPDLSEMGLTTKWPEILDPIKAGKWDLMAEGSWNDDGNNPPYMSSYTKEFLGWLNYDIHPKSAYGEHWIDSIDSSNFDDSIFRYNLEDNISSASQRYYILEARNRNLKTWDSSLPEEKVLILYYVDEKGQREYGYNQYGMTFNQFRIIVIPGGISEYFVNDGILNPAGETYRDLDNLVKFTAVTDRAVNNKYEIQAEIKEITYDSLGDIFWGVILKPSSLFRQKIKEIFPLNPVKTPEFYRVGSNTLKKQLAVAYYDSKTGKWEGGAPLKPPTDKEMIQGILEKLILIFLLILLLIWLNKKIIPRYKSERKRKIIKILTRIFLIISIIAFIGFFLLLTAAIISIVEEDTEKVVQYILLEILILIFLLILLLIWLNKKIIPRYKSERKRKIIKILLIISIIAFIGFLALLTGMIIFASEETISNSEINSSGEIAAPSLLPLTIPDLDLHLYCDDGRHIGVNYETGEYEIQIEGAIVSGDTRDMSEWIFIPPDVTNCHFAVSSYDNQKFLEENPEIAQEMEDTTDSYEVYARYIDPETDIYTSTIISEDIKPGIELEHEITGTHDIVIEPGVLIVDIEIKPETLNLVSQGVFTAFIQLPEEYSVADIDIETIESDGTEAIRGNIRGNDTLVVKFNRQDLVDVSVGDEVEIIITGELIDGTKFKGTDTIRIIEKGKKK